MLVYLITDLYHNGDIFCSVAGLHLDVTIGEPHLCPSEALVGDPI